MTDINPENEMNEASSAGLISRNGKFDAAELSVLIFTSVSVRKTGKKVRPQPRHAHKNKVKSNNIIQDSRNDKN
jgi:hypothetical protein